MFKLFKNLIFLLTLILFSNVSLTFSAPKKRSFNQLYNQNYNNQNNNEIDQIESYFNTDEINILLCKIANKSTNTQFPSINHLVECSQLFSSKPLVCSLDRNRTPNHRKIFENKIVEEFENNLLPNLIQNDELFLNYTSFACGYLFQDFIILNKIIRLIEHKYHQITKINLNLNFIDPITNTENKKCEFFDRALAQLENYLKNKSIDIFINTNLYSETLEYFEECDVNPNYKSDIITCIDYEYKKLKGEMAVDGFKFLILKCLKNDGMFFCLEKNGTLRNHEQISDAIFKNQLTKKETQKIFHKIYPLEAFKTNFLYINGKKASNNPITFYGKINPEKFLLNEINAIHLETNQTFKPYLLELTIR